MSTHRRTKLNSEEAGEFLVSTLKWIITLKERYCAGIKDSEHITPYDNDMALHAVSRIDYDEGEKKLVINDKDILHHPDIAEWTVRFLGSHGEAVFKQLLIRQFIRAENEGMLGAMIQKRLDRTMPLPRISRPQESTCA